MRFALPAPAPSSDPVVQANAAFAQDRRAHRVNLGLGVYTDASGRIPVLQAVAEAAQRLQARGAPHAYLPISGRAACNDALQALVLGPEATARSEGRAVTLQTLGGTGALALAARFVAQLRPGAAVYVSEPTWDNHRAIFEAAGLQVHGHPWLQRDTPAVDLPRLLDALAQAPRGSAVVLHGCCHNPSGADLDETQWEQLLDVLQQRELLPVVDLAYQGFGAGLRADRAPLLRLQARGFEFLVASSLSKSMALYGERVGALTVVADTAAQAAAAHALLQRLVRSLYSNPPTRGAALAAEVLGTPSLAQAWEAELDAMRERIVQMRRQLVQQVASQLPPGAGIDLSFILRQRGMFSYTGLQPHEVRALREDDAIHLIETGRLCVAALHAGNIEPVARALARVLGQRGVQRS